jgi:hypothetical protein
MVSLGHAYIRYEWCLLGICYCRCVAFRFQLCECFKVWSPATQTMGGTAKALLSMHIFRTSLHSVCLCNCLCACVGPPEPSIVANRPFKLIVAGLGFGCDQINPKFKFKLGLGMGFQAIVGGPIGGGCERGSDSDSEGSVDGTNMPEIGHQRFHACACS